MKELNLCILWIDKAENRIGDLGCSFLIQAQWPKLQSLNLSTYKENTVQNNIGHDGCN
jgi:hypothetical protein